MTSRFLWDPDETLLVPHDAGLPGCRRPMNSQGFILSRDAFEAIVAAARAWYDATDQATIDALNWERDPHSPKPAAAPRPRKVEAGTIYVIASGGRYKIGRTTQLGARMRAFRTSTPLPVELVCSFAVPDTAVAEQEWHAVFAAKRLSGEWFALDAEDLALLNASAGATIGMGGRDVRA